MDTRMFALEIVLCQLREELAQAVERRADAERLGVLDATYAAAVVAEIRALKRLAVAETL